MDMFFLTANDIKKKNQQEVKKIIKCYPTKDFEPFGSKKHEYFYSYQKTKERKTSNVVKKIFPMPALFAKDELVAKLPNNPNRDPDNRF